MLKNPDTLPSEYNDTTSPKCKKLLAAEDDEAAAADDAAAIAAAAADVALWPEKWWFPPTPGDIIVMKFLLCSIQYSCGTLAVSGDDENIEPFNHLGC